MRSVKVALVAGLTLLLLAVGLTLLGSPASVARTNQPPGGSVEPIAIVDHNATYCQAGEVLPRDTSAIRVWLEAASGPRVKLAVYSGGHRLTGGEHGSDWIGGSVTVPVRPLARTVSDATVCVSFAVHDETVTVQGTSQPQRMWIEYMRPGTRSWVSLAGEVAHHMGLGRGLPGTWIVFLALALLVSVAGIASAVLVRELP
jgi:hypothetical protein